jgi:DHA3 family macrolide efflux protein-like MFS transporter
LGSQLVGFALIWWLTKTTGSATVLATASLVSLLPQVFLGPFIGTLVDRMNRRLVIIAADGVVALATLVLAALFWTDKVHFSHLYILMFIRSIAGTFHFSAMQASTSLMVPTKHLARIQGMNQMLGGGLNILAAPLGALLLELLPMQGILGIDIATMFLAVLPLFFFAIPQPERKLASESNGVKPTFWQDFRAGLAYVVSWKGLLLIGLMAILINFLLTPAFSLLPILVTKHYQGQAFQLAWFDSAYGVGVMAGGALLSLWGGFKRRIYTSLLGVFAIGIGTLAMGLVPGTMFPLAVGIMFWMGLSNPIANGPLFASVQATVDPEMQGRVFTMLGSVASGMAPLGLIFAGPIADAFGVQAWFLVGGVVTLIMCLFGLSNRHIRRFEEGRKAESQASGVIKTPAAAQETLPG